MRYHKEIFSTPKGERRSREEVETLRKLALKDASSGSIILLVLVVCVFLVGLAASWGIREILSSLITIGVIFAIDLFRSAREYKRDIAFINDTEGALNLSDDQNRWTQVREIVSDVCAEQGLDKPPRFSRSGWQFDYTINIHDNMIVFGGPVMNYDTPMTRDLIRKAAADYVEKSQKKNR